MHAPNGTYSSTYKHVLMLCATATYSNTIKELKAFFILVTLLINKLIVHLYIWSGKQ